MMSSVSWLGSHFLFYIMNRECEGFQSFMMGLAADSTWTLRWEDGGNVYLFTRVALTKHHRLGGLNNKKFILEVGSGG